jgi:hypothetical protein
MMEKGWKPMPVIIKIIWILLLVEAFFAILSVSAAYSNGFEFMGFSLYGMIAVNVFFFAKIAIPIVLIIGMHQRYAWIWVAAIIYYLVFAINGFANIPLAGEMQNKVMAQMPDVPEGMTEDMYYLTVHSAIIFFLVTASLFNVAVMILTFIKRKYFAVVQHMEPPTETDMTE